MTAHDPSSTLPLHEKGHLDPYSRSSPKPSAQLGWPAHTATLYTLAALLPTLLYALPRTAMLGALLLTGYLGDVRIGSPLFSHTLCGVYVRGDGLGWPNLWLRDPRLRGLLPWLR